ncbi:major facilitator superfamily [Mactra antiquata]
MDSELTSPKHFSKKLDGSACRLIFAATCALLGPFSFGFTIGYSSPAIPELEKAGLLSGSQSGWFGALLTVGAMLGGPFAGWCIEKYGRKATIRLTSVPFAIGWLCIFAATGSLPLFVGRFCCGFASGLVTVCVPVYIAEVSTNSLRGTLGAGVQLSITIGILVAYATGITCSWSNMALVGLIPAVLTFFVLNFIPETPRWLLMNGRKQEAFMALKQLRHPHADCEDECRDIEEGLDLKEEFSMSEFRRPELSRPLVISVIIMIFQQFSGINAIMFYTVSIFKSAGLENSEMATVLVGLVQVIATMVACTLMDRMGRRKLLIVAGSIMCLACFMFSWYFHKTTSGTTASDMGILPVVSLVIYIIGFSLGWGPIPMLIMSEIFPSRARGAASGIAVLTNWTCAFFVTKEFLVVQELLGPAVTFTLFGFSCMGSVIYVWKKVPETKGKSLEDIELFFLGKSMMNI